MKNSLSDCEEAGTDFRSPARDPNALACLLKGGGKVTPPCLPPEPDRACESLEVQLGRDLGRDLSGTLCE